MFNAQNYTLFKISATGLLLRTFAPIATAHL